MRIFIAIPFTKEFKQEISASIDPLRQALSECLWTNTENYHVTLRFLGVIEDARVIELEKELNKIVSIPQLKLQFGNLGLLGRNTEVLKITIKKTDQLEILHTRVSEVLARMGIDSDTREFVPHITIGRIKDPQLSVLEHIQQISIGISFNQLDFQVNEIAIMESCRSGAMSHYRIVKSFPLRKASV